MEPNTVGGGLPWSRAHAHLRARDPRGSPWAIYTASQELQVPRGLIASACHLSTMATKKRDSQPQILSPRQLGQDSTL